MAAKENEAESIEFSPDAFRQRFQYQTGSSSSAKQIFAKTHDAFASKEQTDDANGSESATKERLRSKLKNKTQRLKDSKIQRAQSDFLEGNLGATQAMLQKISGGRKGGIKLPPEYKGLLAQMSQMKSALQDMKQQQAAAAPSVESTPVEPLHSKAFQPLRARPSLEEEEKMAKLLRNRRKRDKKKGKESVPVVSVPIVPNS
jgi:hypothetical protein